MIARYKATETVTVLLLSQKCRSGILIAVALAILSIQASAQTADDDVINPDRPGIADGSTVVGSGTFQLESGFHMEFRRSGDTREHTVFVPTLLRFGIGSRFEARIEGNTFTRVTTLDPASTSEHTSGLAPTSIGFKYHIYNSSGERQISVGTIVRVFPSWGS